MKQQHFWPTLFSTSFSLLALSTNAWSAPALEEVFVTAEKRMESLQDVPIVGQGDVQITQDPSVALYMDGVYIGSSVGTAFETADLQRIEVLRGPQGTLYGRNATGGAINIITR